MALFTSWLPSVHFNVACKRKQLEGQCQYEVVPDSILRCHLEFRYFLYLSGTSPSYQFFRSTRLYNKLQPTMCEQPRILLLHREACLYRHQHPQTGRIWLRHVRQMLFFKTFWVRCHLDGHFQVCLLHLYPKSGDSFSRGNLRTYPRK